MKPVKIAVVGGKKAGKTTTIEILTKELTTRGYRIAAVKHIPEPNFTIDKEGKDTWRYAQSGAKLVISASSDEIATIERIQANEYSLENLLRRCSDSDIVFLEGFRKSVAKDKNIHKIVVVKNPEDFAEAAKVFTPILAFTGPYSPKELDVRVHYLDIFRDARKIANILEDLIRKEALT